MGWIISMVLAFIVCGAASLIGVAIRAHERKRAGDPNRQVRLDPFTGKPKPDEPVGGLLIVAACIAFILWFGIHSLVASAKIVPAGHVGVVYQFGDIKGTIGEGFTFLPPWQSKKNVSTQVQRFTFEQVESFSSETQDVFVVATLNYRIDRTAVEALYRNIGTDWFNRIVGPRVNQLFKDETVKYRAVDIAPNREEIRAAVREVLETEMEVYGIDVVDILIDNIDFHDAFTQAIEQKQIAAQDALREEQRVAQARNEAQQAIEKARGAAEATRINAEGQAAANRLLTESLTPLLVQWQAIQQLSDNIQIALLPAGTGLIIDPSTILGSAPIPAANAPTRTRP